MADFEDVPDSTDWLSTPVPGLSAVEAALRCQVCKDFFKTPMLTSCNHTFCSLCIRRILSTDGKCPLCRASDQEHKLRSNWALEEVVDSFVKARKQTLDFARAPGNQATTRSASPKRKLADDDSTTNDQQPGTKRLRSSARLSKAKGADTVASMYHEEVEIPESGGDEDEAEDATFTPEDGLVPCPVCQARMKQWQVFRHLDICPGPDAQQNPVPRVSSSRTPTPNTPAFGGQRPVPAPERLPAINYSMLKDIALRRKMADLGLSTSGSRQQLEKRHKEWITLWNANCDSARPKRRTELLHDLDIWERTQGAKAPFAARAGLAVKDKEFDGAAWAVKHDTSFKDLIANARKSRAQVKQKTDEAAAEAADGPGAAGSSVPVGSGTEAVVVDLTETAAITAHEPEVQSEQATYTDQGLQEPSTAGKVDLAQEQQHPLAAYYLQDGFSEQVQPVAFSTESSQEMR